MIIIQNRTVRERKSVTERNRKSPREIENGTGIVAESVKGRIEKKKDR